MNDPDLDAEELASWAEKVSSDLEGRVLSTDWQALSFTAPDLSDIPKRSTFIDLEHKCTDLFGNLSSSKEIFQELALELEGKEPLTVDLEQLLRTAPPSPQPQPSSPAQAAKD